MQRAPGTAGTLARSAFLVGLAADHGLVAESVRAALSHLGYRAVRLEWPVDARAAATPVPCDVALLISDLDRTDRVSAARLLLAAVDAPCLVLAGGTPGPLWGAMYDAGASLVVPHSIGLAEVALLIDDLAGGRVRDRVPQHGSRDLIGAWRRFAVSREESASRIRTLTQREDEVARMLCHGIAVREIAARSAVSEATVRSQVKAILRKLGVSSQIAAVAAYQEIEMEGTGRPVC